MSICTSIISITGRLDTVSKIKVLLPNRDELLRYPLHWLMQLAGTDTGVKDGFDSERDFGFAPANLYGWGYRVLEGGNCELELYTESGWVTPIQTIGFLSIRFPELKLKSVFHTVVKGFAGYVSFDSGVLDTSSQLYLDDDKESFLDFVGDHFPDDCDAYYGEFEDQ